MAVDSLANLHQKVAQISPNSIFTVDVDFYLEWHFFITSHDSHKDWRLIPSAFFSENKQGTKLFQNLNTTIVSISVV